jgi:hypothetical protein
VNDLCRVTVRGFGHSLDVALPAAVPVADLLPALADLAAFDPAAAGGRPAWTLARVGAPALAPAATLTDAGVVDGEVLYVVDPAGWRPPAVSDLRRDEGPAGAGRRWEAGATAALLAGLGVLAVLVAAVLAAREHAVRDGGGVLLLAAAAGLLGGAMGVRTAPGTEALLRPARVALALCGWIAAGLGAWGVAGPATPAGLAAGAAAVAVCALLTYPLLPAVSPGAALAAATLAAAAGAVAAGTGAMSVAVVVLVLGLVLLRVLTAVCSWLLGLVTAGLDVNLDQPLIAARSRAVRMAMVSLSAGQVAVVLGTVPTLLAGGPEAFGLVLVAALSLLLRAWSYRFLADVLAPAAGALAALLAVEAAADVRLAADPALVVAALTATGLALAGASAVWTAVPAPSRPPRAGWLLADLLMLPLALGALGVFDAVALLVRHLLHLS